MRVDARLSNCERGLDWKRRQRRLWLDEAEAQYP
jgi:hypothetical protein